MLLARTTRAVLATDFHLPSLRLCMQNAALNKHTFSQQQAPQSEPVVRARLLDWTAPASDAPWSTEAAASGTERVGSITTLSHKSEGDHASATGFKWSPRDAAVWDETRVLFAR